MPTYQKPLQMKILMVCLGNICRSPLAEGIMQSKIDHHQLDWKVDSAGTGAYHAGEKADPRSIAIARQHNIDISHQRSRLFQPSDFVEYDHIFVMDSSNFQNVIRLARSNEEKEKVELIMNMIEPKRNVNVPDPYWGEYGFEKVYNMLDEATDAILERYKN
jgi:protein-tyrosine phosphatase